MCKRDTFILMLRNVFTTKKLCMDLEIFAPNKHLLRLSPHTYPLILLKNLATHAVEEAEG